MHKPEYEPFNTYFEQQDHKRMHQWMRDHGWSTSMAADPADIVEIKELYDLGLLTDQH